MSEEILFNVPNCLTCESNEEVILLATYNNIKKWNCICCKPFFTIDCGSSYAQYIPTDEQYLLLDGLSEKDVKNLMKNDLKDKMKKLKSNNEKYVNHFKCHNCGKDFGVVPNGSGIMDGAECPICLSRNTSLVKTLLKVEKSDPVNHPSHYTGRVPGIECIDVTRYFSFTRGSAIKYLWRAGEKDPSKLIEDLKKAIWYINDEIKEIEAENFKNGIAVLKDDEK